jgi:hypothetical protein
VAREVTVTLGGEERRLMFDAARAAIEIEKRLGKAPTHVHDDDLRPGVHKGGFSTASLVFLLWLGLRHEVKGLKEDTVLDWVSAAYRENLGGMLCEHVRDALALSGVFGWSYDAQAPKEPEERPEEGDGDGGKAPAVKAAE